MNTNEKQKKVTNKKLYLGSAIVIIIWLVSFPVIKLLTNYKTDFSQIGIVGDSFGAINALFSGLAFVGLIFTIYLQKNELRLQREELKLQRFELKENREQLRRSAESQEKTEYLIKKQLRLGNRTAKIDALTTIINSYNNDIYGGHTKKIGGTLTQKRNEKLKTLDKMVNDINLITKDLDN
jgi:hypothetical protein